MFLYEAREGGWGGRGEGVLAHVKRGMVKEYQGSEDKLNSTQPKN